MSNSTGPFPQTTFLGATATSFSSSVGWNEQQSSLTVNLVEDPLNRDRFVRPTCGTPASFAMGDFKFGGLIQRWVQKNDFQGNPAFEVTMTDPREILSGAQAILSSYRGNVGNFRNLINVYGYWEDVLGFGGSLVNESGMVWNSTYEIIKPPNLQTGGGFQITPVGGGVGIMPGLVNIINGAFGPYGGALHYLGHDYRIDLSSLPVPPPYYRMGGVASSVLDMISELCGDAGSDFYCYLDGQTIKFRTVSRRVQPQPGQIDNFIASRQDIVSKNIGYELRTDVNNAVLMGGDVTSLSLIVNSGGGQLIWPFWGFDVNNNVVVGEGNPSEGHTFNLNAAEVADVLGDVTYASDIPEMRFARMDMDSWAFYVMKKKPDIADAIGMVCAIDSTSELQQFFQDTMFSRDMIAATEATATQYGKMNDSDFWTQRMQRMYDFVRRAAEEWFGRKFLVSIPFSIFWKFEPETTHRVSSDEPTDAGYMPEGSMPLGLNFLNEGQFLSDDGRYQCFVKFADSADKMNMQQVPPSAYVVQDNDVYVRAQVDQEIGIVYLPNSYMPYCVVTLESPVLGISPDPLGGIDDIAHVMDPDDDTLGDRMRQGAAGLRFDSFPIRISPAPFRPDAVALPMKSNRDSYGPWFTSGGVDGKITFERDEELVPWNYGSYDLMNQAAQAKLANAATAMQYTETGTVEVAGFPERSLSDSLAAGGPELTGIDVSRATGGFTTVYRMQTYTPRMVGFSRGNAERLRRMGKAAQDMRRLVRNLYQRQLMNNQIYQSAFIGRMANASRAVRQATPHQCIVATMTWDDDYGYRTQVATQTAAEAMANVRGDDEDIWPLTGLMTLEGLLRPFSTNRARDADDPLGDMPHYETVQNNTWPVTRAELDPFAGTCDVDFLAWGDEYPGDIHTIRRDPDFGNTRTVGFRGPLVMVGWGYSYTGKPVPNANSTDAGGADKPEDQWSDAFLSDHRLHPEKWKAGPVGLFWDNWRKMWTIPTILLGTINSDGTMAPEIDPLAKIALRNFVGTGQAGQKVVAAYDQFKNRWVVIAVECVTA